MLFTQQFLLLCYTPLNPYYFLSCQQRLQNVNVIDNYNSVKTVKLSTDFMHMYRSYFKLFELLL